MFLFFTYYYVILTQFWNYVRRQPRRYVTRLRMAWKINPFVAVAYTTYWPAMIVFVALVLTNRGKSFGGWFFVYSVLAWLIAVLSFPEEKPSPPAGSLTRPSRLPGWLREFDLPARKVRVIVILSLAMAFIVVLPLWAILDVFRVRHGEPSRGGSLLGLMMWGGQNASVSWLADSSTTPSAVRAGHDLIYLGTAGETHILYDVNDSTTLRLPASDVVMSTRRRWVWWIPDSKEARGPSGAVREVARPSSSRR
jgi:hypothetical protein